MFCNLFMVVVQLETCIASSSALQACVGFSKMTWPSIESTMEHVLYERIFDLWEKTKIESNQLYITDEQEKEARENIRKCNREKTKKERKRLELDWKFYLFH